MPHNNPPLPPFAPLPGAALAPLPIRGRPVRARLGALIRLSRSCWTVCAGLAVNAATLAVSAHAGASAAGELARRRAQLPDEGLAQTVVGAVAAAFAAFSVEPIFAKSEAAAVTNSGAAITKDI